MAGTLTSEQEQALILARARARAAKVKAEKVPFVDQPDPAKPEQGWGDWFQEGGMDFLRTAPGALTRGATAIAGAPGSINELMMAGLDRLFQPTPEDLRKRKELESQMLIPSAPSQGTLMNAAIQATRPAPDKPSPLEYEPKTQFGKYGGKALEYGPAIAAGPGSWGSKVLTGIGSVLGGETARQAAEGTPYEPWAEAGGALAGGGILPTLTRRVVTPLPTATSRKQHYGDVLRKEGVPLTAGQRTGTTGLGYMESELGGGAARRFQARQGEEYTRAAMRHAGESHSLAEPEDINRAHARLGGIYDQLQSRNTLVADQRLLNELADHTHAYGEIVEAPSRVPVVNGFANETLNLWSQHGGRIPGEAYKSLRSRMGDFVRGTKNSEAADAVRKMQLSLDNAMDRSIAANNPADLGAWRKVNKQYGNLMTIEKAAAGAGEQAAEGIIFPSRLRAATVANKNYVRGKSDLARLARAGESVMRPLPQSGTGSRMAVRGIPATIGAILGGGHTGDMSGALLGALGGQVVPAALGRAVLSAPVRRLLGNQVARNWPSNLKLASVIAALQAQKGISRPPYERKPTRELPDVNLPPAWPEPRK